MTQWTAQTRFTENKCIPPYNFSDSLFSGFRGTHWISGSCMQEYGSSTIMPVVGKLKTSNYAISFSHEDETAKPSYYKLNIASLTSEITSTLRCGMMRFTMLQDDSLYLLITPNSDAGEGFVKIDHAKEQCGAIILLIVFTRDGTTDKFQWMVFIQFEKVLR